MLNSDTPFKTYFDDPDLADVSRKWGRVAKRFGFSSEILIRVAPFSDEVIPFVIAVYIEYLKCFKPISFEKSFEYSYDNKMRLAILLQDAAKLQSERLDLSMIWPKMYIMREFFDNTGKLPFINFGPGQSDDFDEEVNNFVISSLDSYCIGILLQKAFFLKPSVD